jgi:hypothetical protein
MHSQIYTEGKRQFGRVELPSSGSKSELCREFGFLNDLGPYLRSFSSVGGCDDDDVG